MDDPSIAAVHRYHDGTKHNYGAFARSLGYLDWASQPRPFRAFAGAPFFPLYPDPSAPSNGYAPRPVLYDRLRDRFVPGEPVSAAAIGDVLRHALGLSAWKELGSSRWSLRVNPSSGNLHPTEAYVVCGAMPGLSATPAVYHYAAEHHGLELRCAVDDDAWRAAAGGPGANDVLLIALTSIHWRESWKYGERAFRYCQHDLGHAIAAIGMSAALAGWRATVLPDWSHAAIATLTGIDRDQDFNDGHSIDAEREEPGVVIAIGAAGHNAFAGDRGRALAGNVGHGQWSGHASQVSVEHVEWTFIEEIARATQTPGVQALTRAHGRLAPGVDHPGPIALDARTIFKQRRSAVALDGLSSTDRSTFMQMLSRVMPAAGAPWDAAWWTPRMHLALFVHRVTGVPPGLYMLVREADALERLRAACGRDFLWEAGDDALPLYCLATGDCRRLAARLSCDQNIAADGFFSLGMIADFDRSLEEYGGSFYRNLFWEAGAIGQALYLEAEAAGARATGIGCFYDDPVHDVLGLQGHAFQSLYHFTVGIPVDDGRLTTTPGYPWESLAPLE